MTKTGQAHHTIADLPSADQVWQSLLGELMETPLEIPGSWTDESSAKWDSNGNCLVVSAPPVEKEGWVEKRFLPLARIYLDQQLPGKSLVVMQKGGPEKPALLLRVQRSVYEKIVEPHKIVPVQIYMFQHWLPILGASAFWVAAAMRQASFVSKDEEACVVKPISSRVLEKWAPLTYSQITRLLNTKGFSSWFYKKVKDGYEDVPPEYNVWRQIPVAPHHLYWIEERFKEYAGEESATSILESLIDRTGEIRRVKPGEFDLPATYNTKRRTILDLVSQYFPGNISQEVSDLVVQLEHLITRPNLAVTIPHYFYKKYMGSLTSNEAALIWYLRSLYRDDESAEVHFVGYGSLATALGFNRMTAQRLIEKCKLSNDEEERTSWKNEYMADLSLGNWLSAMFSEEHINGTPREYSIKIRGTEPIHSDDIGYYNRQINALLVSSNGTSNTKEEPAHIATGGAQNETGVGITPAHIATGGAQNETPLDQNSTGVKQISTGSPHKMQHYNSFNTNNSLTDSYNDSLIPPQPSLFDDELSTDTSVVGVREINLEKLLGFGSYKHNEKKKLIKVIEKNEEIFLAWFIRNHITAAKFPVRLAVKNVQEGNETEDQYLELARLGWGITAQLAGVHETTLSMWAHGIVEEHEDQEELIKVYQKLSKTARKEISKLKDTRFEDVYGDIEIGKVNV
ncbi:MAG: hypothetical protein DRI65_02215 [Chloroflexota bacterium]|nr:MAG: hypothetical protein DRI65_02215 [Chloroflexota bacterium]